MFEHISAFDFTYEIVQTKTKKTEINLNIELSSFINSFHQQEKIMELFR